MAFEIPEIAYAFRPQLKFMEVGILLTYFAVSCSSLSEDSAEFRFILYILRFRIKFCCVKKRFGFYFDQSERRNEFLTRAKIVSSNHKPRFKRIVFSRSSRLALSGSFDKIIFSVYSSCS